MKGRKWIWNTLEEWHTDYFKFWSTRTIKKIIRSLEKSGLLLSCQPDGRMSRRKYYAVNYNKLDETLNREGEDSSPSMGKMLPLPERAHSSPSCTETASETLGTETSRTGEQYGGLPAANPPGDFHKPSLDEVNAYWKETYIATGRATEKNRDAALIWFNLSCRKGWVSPSGQRIRNWRKALDSYITAFKPSGHDKISVEELREHAEEIGMEDSEFDQYLRYRRKDKCLTEDSITGKLTPITDIRAHMESFHNSLQENRRYGY